MWHYFLPRFLFIQLVWVENVLGEAKRQLLLKGNRYGRHIWILSKEEDKAHQAGNQTERATY